MKRIFSLVTVSMLTLSLFFALPLRVSAAKTSDAYNWFDLGRENSLTVTYHAGQTDLDGTGVKLYFVAGWSEEYDYILTNAFAGSGIQPQKVESNDGWLTVADTLDAFLQANSPEACAEAVLRDGKAAFSDLAAGLYFIPELSITEENGIRTFSPVLINLPDYGENDYGEFTWLYDITTAPKSESYTPTYKDATHFINVIWDDKGYEQYRPASVTADIYANGELYQSVVLSSESNWHFEWTSKDDGTVWTVNGSKVNKYELTVRELEGGWTLEYHFAEPETPPTPKTGEEFPWLAFVLMGVSGMALVVFGFRSRRTADE